MSGVREKRDRNNVHREHQRHPRRWVQLRLERMCRASQFLPGLTNEFTSPIRPARSCPIWAMPARNAIRTVHPRRKYAVKIVLGERREQDRLQTDCSGDARAARRSSSSLVATATTTPSTVNPPVRGGAAGASPAARAASPPAARAAAARHRFRKGSRRLSSRRDGVPGRQCKHEVRCERAHGDDDCRRRVHADDPDRRRCI